MALAGLARVDRGGGNDRGAVAGAPIEDRYGQEELTRLLDLLEELIEGEGRG